MYGYSLLVKQYALTESAYSYWEQLRINSNEQGGLYSKQPLAIKGNLRNVKHPDQPVLGFFSASSMKSKRIFIRNVEDLVLDFESYCTPEENLNFKDVTPQEYPLYFLITGHGLYGLSLACYDCIYMGGVNIKPSYWPY